MKFFTENEVRDLDPALARLLDIARGLAMTPFVITQGLRDPYSSIGVVDSAHKPDEFGVSHAVDLGCTRSSERHKIVLGLIAAGFTRIGIYDRHVHVDNDTTKPQNVIWMGKSV